HRRGRTGGDHAQERAHAQAVPGPERAQAARAARMNRGTAFRERGRSFRSPPIRRAASCYHVPVMRFSPIAAASAALLAWALPAAAAGPLQPIAFVICADQQGSGALISLADGGYVATAGHVVLDDAGNPPRSCVAGFPDASGAPQTFYDATLVRATFDRRA